MLRDQRLENLFHSLSLTDQAKQIVEKIRSSEPLRKVCSGGNNVSGSYASQKMGKTIQFESHKVELPGIELFYEFDDRVLEYYDQAFKLTLKFKSTSGRNVVVSHIPDFFIIQEDSIGFEEWKTEEKLEKLSQKYPERYLKSENGKWYSPPAEEVVKPLGFYYYLRSNKEIDWIKYRNLQFLKTYLQKEYAVDEEITKKIISVVSSTPGITLEQLREQTKGIDVDNINALIASRKIYVDLSIEPLVEPNRVQIFLNQETSKAYLVARSSLTSNHISPSNIINIKIGSSISWDGKVLTIDLVGDSKIILRGQEGLISWTYEEFDSLVRRGEITGLQLQEPLSSFHPEAWHRFLKGSPEAYKRALQRYQAIEPHLRGDPCSPTETSERTIRHWKAKFRLAQQKYGCGFVGLIDNESAKGNRDARFSPDVWEFVDKIIQDYYEDFVQRDRLDTYGILLREWEKAGNVGLLPTYQSFCKRLKQRADSNQVLKRQGRRAAYQKSAFYWELELTTPRHGDRPFEICHIDHTEIDLSMVCSYTGRNLGRAWLTILIDAFSRRILAAFITFDPPSYRSCMMVLRVCVERFNRFPETIVVDYGAEFASVYFDTLLATFNCTKKHRPKSKPRFGSLIERFFGSSNTEIFYNLRANTQITKNVRVVTKANDPELLAVWTLDELYGFFAYGYCYNFYERKEHPSLLQSPHDAFAAGIANSGSRTSDRISYDENFKMLTLPSTRKGVAKVQPSRGVKINGRYYWAMNDFFINPNIEGKEVPVRYDPFDLGIAYAYINQHWIKCISEQYKFFNGRSEREVKLISAELRSQQKLHSQKTSIRAKDLADYLESAEESEALLTQRLRDLANKDIRSLIKTQQAPQPKPSTTQPIPTDETEYLDAQQLVQVLAVEEDNFEQPYKVEELW